MRFYITIIVAFSLLLSGCSVLNNEDLPFKSMLDALGVSVGNEEINVNDEIVNTPAATAESTAEVQAVAESTDTPEPTPTSYSIHLWVPPQFDTESDTKAGKALSEAIAYYMEEHPNVSFSLRVKALSGESSMLNSIIAADHVAKDTLPTLALMSRSDLEFSVQRGLVQPIETSVFSDSGTWYNYARQAAVVDNTVYGIPVLGDGLVLTYRTSKIGAELGEWQDILGRGLPIGFAPSSSTSLFGPFIYLSLGGKLTNDQGQPYLDQQKLTETLNFFLTGGQNGAFPPSIAQLVDQTQVWQRFTDGTMSIIVTSFSSYRHFQTSDMSMLPLPVQSDAASYPLINTWNLVSLEDDPEIKAEAVKFAEYLSSITKNDEFSAAAGYLPVRNSEHELWKSDPQFEAVNLMNTNGVLISNNTLSNKLYPVINTAITQIIRNQATPENAAKEAIAALN